MLIKGLIMCICCFSETSSGSAWWAFGRIWHDVPSAGGTQDTKLGRKHTKQT